MMKKLLTGCLLLLLQIALFAQKFDSIALTPQMGWNSWNTFATNINEQLVKETADALVNLGLKDAGYQYLVLDDGWMAMERDANGNLLPHPEKFPHGIKAVADYVHSKGLKFGLYNCAGAKTCAGYPGSRGHEYQDARKYAEWGVDFLKYDWCNTGKMNAEEAYSTMRDALHAAGRPVLFSLCEWGTYDPWQWGGPVGHSWRISGDIYNCFDCKHDHGGWYSWGALQILDMRNLDTLRTKAGPGRWNDLDMLEVGNGGMTAHEERTHFALWALLNSPLMLGNDLRNMKPETLTLLKNKEVIRINQDPLGIQGFKWKTIGNVEVWVKPLANEEWAICFFNRSKTNTPFEFNWSGQSITDSFLGKTLSFNGNVYKLKELFTDQQQGNTSKKYSASLGSYQSVLLRLSK